MAYTQMVKKNNWSANGFGKNISPDIVSDEFLDTEIVILLQGTNLFGNPIYSYVQINGRNLKEMFRKMQAGDNFKPAEFGTVLQAGTGQPSAEVRQEMADAYNLIDVPTGATASGAAAATKPAGFVQPKFFGDN